MSKYSKWYSLVSATSLVCLMAGCGGGGGGSSPILSNSVASSSASVMTTVSSASSAVPVVSSSSASSQMVVAPAVPENAKFAQNITGTLLLVGQEKVSLDEYIGALGQPAGLMFYTDLSQQLGLSAPIGGGGGCDDAGITDLQHYIGGSSPASPHAIIQLGLALTGGQLAEVTTGSLDTKIRGLATFLKSTGHPILLRIGYEAEGPWNNYPAATYIQAFQRIVTILRGGQVAGVTGDVADNVAMVWHLAAGNNAISSYTVDSISEWYPGDAYVDWIAVSWFGQGTNTSGASSDSLARNVVASFAATHAKPLMIAESAPRDFTASPNNQMDPNIPTASTSWASWYKPILDWNEANKVRIWSYINQDWRAYPMFAGSCGNGGNIWGNSRIEQIGSTVKSSWQSMLSSPSATWPVKADSPTLWCDIGFQTSGCK